MRRRKSKPDRPEYAPGVMQIRGWGKITADIRSLVTERDSHICALCGDYTDENHVLHHMVYRKRRDGGPWPAKPEDLITVHNNPVHGGRDMPPWCLGQKDLPWIVIAEDTPVDTSQLYNPREVR